MKKQGASIARPKYNKGENIMMVKPTIKHLLKNIDNRYNLVIATARRARQISEGAPVYTKVDEKSPVTLAANEIAEGKVNVC